MGKIGRKSAIIHCEICNEDVHYFSRHLANKHPEISQLEYFNKYIRTSEKQGFCKTCGKPLQFINAIVGYSTYCCASCQMKDPDIQQKYKDTYKAKTGYEHNFKNPDAIAKIKQTQIEKYGGIGWASQEIRNKTVNCMKNPEITAKIVKSRFEHFNGEYFSEKGKEKIINVNKNIEKIEKAVQTKYQKNNGKYLSEEAINNMRKRAIKSYSNKVNILKFKYKGSICECKCDKCGMIYDINYSTMRTRLYAGINPCTKCLALNSSTSNYENEIVNCISTFYNGEVQQHNRTILNPQEIDIYIPEKKLAIEFDGVYWHNELFKDEKYHVNKTNECERQNIQLIHIFEDEWLHKNEIVKSRLKGLLGYNDRIYARKCEIKVVSSIDSAKFLMKNHIQGNCISKYNYGLYYNNELVSIMTFGKSRFTDEYELLRFCNKLYTNVVGGASRLLKHFRKDHPEIKKIISYADRRWSKGNLYEMLGFIKVHVTTPSYYYVVDGIRENRLNYQKHKLVKEGFDSTKTEHEIMLERHIYRIYDCGTLKYEYA